MKRGRAPDVEVITSPGPVIVGAVALVGSMMLAVDAGEGPGRGHRDLAA